jgi:hypothetical protein
MATRRGAKQTSLSTRRTYPVITTIGYSDATLRSLAIPVKVHAGRLLGDGGDRWVPGNGSREGCISGDNDMLPSFG